MSNYTKSTNFTSKDALPSGNPLKIVKGAEFDTEFQAIATAVNSKADIDSPEFTGTPTAPTAGVGTSNSQVATTAFVGASLGAAVPAGVYFAYGGSTAPAGYLLCNGAAVSRTTYAALYAAIGTTFGAGNGSTTFNVPNLQGRMPMGSATGFAAGTTGGSKDAAVIAHSHSGSTSAVGDHTHSVGYNNGTVSGEGTAGGNTAFIPGGGGAVGTGGAGAHSHTFTTDSTGTSGINANLPPYLASNWIIKT